MAEKIRRRINFIPQEMRPTIFGTRVLVAILILVLIGVPLVGAGARALRLAAEHHLAGVTHNLEDLTTQISTRIQARDSSAEKLATAAVQKALSEKLFWADVFKELSNVAPKSIWLTNFETSVDGEGKKVVIAGQGTSQIEIAEFFGRLERSYFFRFVQMKFTEITEVGGASGFRFQFEGRVFEEAKGAKNGSS